MLDNYMKTISLLFSIIFLFCQPACSYALDWKKLHEEADKTGPPAALMQLKNNPDSIDNLYILGLVYLNLHRDKEAGEVFVRIIDSNPQIIEAKWGLAEALRRRHDLEKSEVLLEEVINANPEFSPAYVTLAYIRYRDFKLDDAVKLASRVIQQGRVRVDLSNYTRAYLIIGGAKGMIAHYGGPLSKFINGTAVSPNLRKAQELQPDSAGVMFGMGSFYLLAPAFAGGDLKKAEEYLKKAVEIDPLFADAYVRLGQFYKATGKEEEYRKYLDRALEIDPGNELANDIKDGRCRFICIK